MQRGRIPRGRGSRGNRNHNFQGQRWRSNDRGHHPGPSRPANPGPNNPNYNQTWENEWPGRECYTEGGEGGRLMPSRRDSRFDDQAPGVNRGHQGSSSGHHQFHEEYSDHQRREDHRDIDERSYSRRTEPDWHPYRDHHTIREIEKRNQSLMQQSPNTENRRPPSPRVFYPGSPKNNIQAESPSFINERSPSFSAPENSGEADRSTRWDQGSEKKIRKDLFNSTNQETELVRPQPPMPGNSSSIESGQDDRRHFDDGIRTFDYTNQQPTHSSPVQFTLRKCSKKFIDYSSNPLARSPSPTRRNSSEKGKGKSERKSERERKGGSPYSRRSRSPRGKKKKSKDKTRSNSTSPKRSKKSSRVSRRSRENSRKVTLDESEQDLYEIELNEDIPYVPMAVPVPVDAEDKEDNNGPDEEEHNETPDDCDKNVEIPQVLCYSYMMSNMIIFKGICGYISTHDTSSRNNDGKTKT
jgi:hypothetical protein